MARLAERHAKLLNALAQGQPTLLEGGASEAFASVFRHAPKVLSFATRAAHFRWKLDEGRRAREAAAEAELAALRRGWDATALAAYPSTRQAAQRQAYVAGQQSEWEERRSNENKLKVTVRRDRVRLRLLPCCPEGLCRREACFRSTRPRTSSYLTALAASGTPPLPQVLQDSFEALHATPASRLESKRMAITFSGEAGNDDGGLTREWYSLLSRAIFDPQAALFVPCSRAGVAFAPSKDSGVNPSHLEYFKFVGKIVGKAVLDGHALDVYFTRAFYKHLLQQPVTLEARR